MVKIGSALLTNDGLGLDHKAIGEWVEQLADLQQKGYEIVLVSSGSVAEGLVRLGWNVGTPDGNWDETSRSAAREFQVAIDVEVDGEPDQELLNQLKSSYRQGNANDLVMGLAAQFLRALGKDD